jgi:hypothetical protein
MVGPTEGRYEIFGRRKEDTYTKGVLIREKRRLKKV